MNRIKDCLAHNNIRAEDVSYIDLTGQMPGLVYMLEGNLLGNAWLVGGYPGSERAAIAQLKTESSDSLRSALILSEEGGEREIKISNDLRQFGIDFPSNYSLLLESDIPQGAGDNEKRKILRLYKPEGSQGERSKDDSTIKKFSEARYT